MFEKEAGEYAKPFYDMTRYDYVEERTHVREAFQKGAEFGYNKAFVEADKNLKAVVADFNKANEEAKAVIQDLLNNSDEYAQQRAMDWLKEVNK